MTPYYERTLDSFADAVITRTIRSERNWYAVLDTGPYCETSLDFSTCRPTEAEAIAACAAKIRADAKGIGKYAPHGLLTPCYDLHFRLMRWWAEKEVNFSST